MSKYFRVNDNATDKYGAMKGELFTSTEMKKYRYDADDFKEIEVSRGKIGYYGKHRMTASKKVNFEG